MKRYMVIFYHLFIFLLKSNLSYRFNFFIRLFYGPAYTGILFIILLLAFHNSPTLAGWSQNQAALIFGSFNLLYAVGYTLYFQGVRHQLWGGIRDGEIDLILVKPLSAQFLFAFSYPNYEQIFVVLGMIGLLGVFVVKTMGQITLLSFGLYMVTMALGLLIHYLITNIYATSGFYFIKAAQVLETIDKMTDFASYPISLFPRSIQMAAFTVIPIAFLSYVPVLFLLQKGSLKLFLFEIIFIWILLMINKVAWKYGLRNYSSASS